MKEQDQPGSKEPGMKEVETKDTPEISGGYFPEYGEPPLCPQYPQYPGLPGDLGPGAPFSDQA